MKQAGIVFAIAIGLALITLYLFEVTNPLSTNKLEQLVQLRGYTKPEEVYAEIVNLVNLGVIKDYISLRSVIIVIGVACLSLTSLFIAAHLFIDKFFFKAFYRPPDLRLALRRGVLVYLSMVAFVVLRFLGIEILLSLTPVLLALVIELLISTFVASRKAALENDIIANDEQ